MPDAPHSTALKTQNNVSTDFLLDGTHELSRCFPTINMPWSVDELFEQIEVKCRGTSEGYVDGDRITAEIEFVENLKDWVDSGSTASGTAGSIGTVGNNTVRDALKGEGKYEDLVYTGHADGFINGKVAFTTRITIARQGNDTADIVVTIPQCTYRKGVLDLNSTPLTLTHTVVYHGDGTDITLAG